MRTPAAGFLSPVVRRLATELGVDPSQLRGTGRNGRVTRDDVLRAAAAPAPAPSVLAAPPPAAPAAPSPSPLAAPPPDGPDAIPFSKLRRQMAERLVASKRTAAHATCSTEVDLESVARVRAAFGAAFRAQTGTSLTYLPFFARATIEALAEYPHLNGTVGDDALHVSGAVHLGIAVDLDGEGLLIPVVRDAQAHDLRTLAGAIHDLATRARTGRLRPDDVSGGTFTITNPGPFGTVLSAPIIHAPQVAILVTDGVRRLPVVVQDAAGDEGIAVHAVATLGCSFDHRAVDGAYVSAFVARVRQILETRPWAADLHDLLGPLDPHDSD